MGIDMEGDTVDILQKSQRIHPVIYEKNLTEKMGDSARPQLLTVTGFLNHQQYGGSMVQVFVA